MSRQLVTCENPFRHCDIQRISLFLSVSLSPSPASFPLFSFSRLNTTRIHSSTTPSVSLRTHLLGGLVLHVNGVPDHLAHFFAPLFSHTLRERHRSDSAGLRHHNVRPRHSVQQELRHLRRHNSHGVFSQLEHRCLQAAHYQGKRRDKNTVSARGAKVSTSDTGHAMQSTHTSAQKHSGHHTSDKDHDTLTEGQPTSVRKPGPTDMSVGVTTPGKRNLFKLSCLALAARCATGTL